MTEDEHRQLDAQIHEQVLGLCAHVLTYDRPGGFWGRIYRCTKCGAGPFDFANDHEGAVRGVPQYSTDIRAAMEVLATLPACFIHVKSKDWYLVQFAGMDTTCYGATTMAAAICKAALVAVGVETPA